MSDRTPSQNNALHQYFDDLSTAFQAAGLDMKQILKPGVEIPATPELVKNLMWRPIQKIMVDKESTTELTTTDIDAIYQVMARHIASRFGISVPFPNRFNQGDKQY